MSGRDSQGEGAEPVATPLASALPWLAAPLQELLSRYQGHATLIHGFAGDGAHDLAIRLGQAWLCEGDAALRPCGRCAACRLFDQGSHPDQNWLLPQDAALTRGLPVDIKEGRKPSKQIRIDEVRQVIDGMSTTSGRGRGKALVIFPAEAMNAIAASALLKTLEEPPAGTRIVLTAAEPARLLPTILSRCRRYRLPTPPAEQAINWLREQSVEQAEVLLAACAGHPLDAWSLHRNGVTAQRWLALPQRLAQGDASALSGWAMPQLLDALAKLCHDAMAHAVGARPRFFPGAAMPQGLRLMKLSNWQRQLQSFQRNADHPWNEPLLADALAREAQEALQSVRMAAHRPSGEG